MKSKIMTFVFPITTIAAMMVLASTATQANESLKLSSPAFVDNGTLPVQFTCEGEGISPPLNWSGVPDGTQSFVVIMDHLPNQRPAPNNEEKKPKPITDGDEKNTPPPPAQPKESEEGESETAKKTEELRWYWSLYNIPAKTSGITANNKGEQVGTLGGNVVNDKNEYAPPCSKGPGQKDYTFHLYALSKPLALTTTGRISEATLRKSMSGLVLDSDSLTVSFERSCQSPSRSPEKPHPKTDNQQEKKERPSDLPLCEKKNEALPSESVDVL